ncbi:putative bifunctional diguanylate cyclase/phosphodiesterase [Ketobacter sp.]|mgnify:CR=1 FL=1|nr:MAG: EAL domain-containing protein [Ketobacter sp.]
MSTLLPDVLCKLKIAVLEFEHELGFKVVGSLPDWFQAMFPDDGAMWYDLAKRSPFLENFLVDARAHWERHSELPIDSGIWSEYDTGGNEHQLQAVALSLGEKPVLVITDISDSFAEQHRVYQRARDIALENEKLMLELNRQQRELQSVIANKLASPVPQPNLQETIEHYSSAILIHNTDGHSNLMNRALHNIYYHDSENSSLTHSVLDTWITEAQNAYPELELAVANGAYWEGDFTTTDLNGIKKRIRLSLGPIKSSTGQVTQYICIANDISTICRNTLEVEAANELDLTTHLPNRHYFWKQMTNQVEISALNQTSFALLYIDLDHFKRVNESLGHHAGDYLLSTFAARLNNNVKQGDILVHLGGDEFAVIANVDHRQKAETIARRLLDALDPVITIDNTQVTLSATIGIAFFPDDGSDATTLMKHADLAMFHAKELGRNQYQHFNAQIHSQFLNRLTLENDIDTALSEDQFELYYQPQVCLGHEPFLRLEALIRWHHPEHGLITPAHFMPIAEKSGQIIEIGDWVTREACRQAVIFSEKQINVVVAINVSAHQVRRSDFVPNVLAALHASGLPPKHLELEITETSFLEDMESVIATLTELRAKGITISIDDFGSGFSSLSYLKSLPVDHIKLDQGFVRELPNHEESKAITVSVIRLAHELNMKVVAEGVETEAQLQFLRGQQCDYVQGFLFFKPMAAGRIPDLFDSIRNANINYH